MKRRDALRQLSTGSLLAGTAMMGASEALAQAPAPTVPPAPKGLPPIRIKDIQTILTAPNRIRLVVVKVVTDQPGLYGWGCATFTQRALVVKTAIDEYLKPFLIGRRVDEIEDIFQSSYVSSYWRNGPVLFNAMSGVDIALWDILGKRAGLPLYQLLGGKVRHGADCYYHASGGDFKELEDNARKGMSLGFRHVRVQGGLSGLATYGARSAGAKEAGPRRRAHRPDRAARHLGVGRLRAHAAQAVRASADHTWRRGAAAARRARARPAERRHQPVQGARALQPVLPRGPVPARRQRLVPPCCASRPASRSRWASCSIRCRSICRSSPNG